MAEKISSFIIENFPFELRADLDLLSRRIDVVNEDKQDELFKILRKYKIQNFVPILMGTNRCTFTWNGYIIKCALEVAGTVDNKKEFEIANKLQQYVCQIYEITSNCHIMVCEYIQPFDTFEQMLEYKEEILSISHQLSLTYSFEDFVIDEKNFRKWGIRIGTNKPVCLDFADFIS